MNRKRPVPESDEIPPGQLIWATLTGYPAWPAITCKRANSESCERIKNGRKEIFVIFIEEKPSSAYVDAKSVLRFDADLRSEYLNHKGFFFSSFPGWYWGVMAALDDFAHLSPDQRTVLMNKFLDETKKKDSESKSSAFKELIDSKKNISPVSSPLKLSQFCVCKVLLPTNCRFSDRETMLPCCACENYYHLSCVGLKRMPKNNRAWVCDECAEDPAKVNYKPHQLTVRFSTFSETFGDEKSERKKKKSGFEEMVEESVDETDPFYDPFAQCECDICGPRWREMQLVNLRRRLLAMNPALSLRD